MMPDFQPTTHVLPSHLFRPPEMHFAAPAPGPNIPPRPERLMAEDLADRIVALDFRTGRQIDAVINDPAEQDRIRQNGREQMTQLIQPIFPINTPPTVRELATAQLLTRVEEVNRNAAASLRGAKTPADSAQIDNEQREDIAALLEPHISINPTEAPIPPATTMRERFRRTVTDRNALRHIAEGFLAGILVSGLALGAFNLYQSRQTAASPSTVAAGSCRKLPAGSIAVGYDYTIDGKTIYNSPDVGTVIEAYKPMTFCAGDIKGMYQIVGSTDPDRLNAVADNYRRTLQSSGCAGGQGCSFINTVIVK